MKKGFNDSNFDVEFELPKEQINKLLKEYKKIKKYQRSNLFTVKLIDGTENIVSKMTNEAKEVGF